PDRRSLGRLRWPLVAAAVAAVLAFAFSVSPATSFAGSYLRYESLPVRLAYLVLAAVPVWLLRDDRSRDRLVAAFVLGTSIASLEALQQLVTSAPFRPDGNVGNAGILAAMITMAVPLAIARALRGGLFSVAWWLGVVARGRPRRDGGLPRAGGAAAEGTHSAHLRRRSRRAGSACAARDPYLAAARAQWRSGPGSHPSLERRAGDAHRAAADGLGRRLDGYRARQISHRPVGSALCDLRPRAQRRPRHGRHARRPWRRRARRGDRRRRPRRVE